MNRRLLILAALALGVWIAAMAIPTPRNQPAVTDEAWPPVALSGVEAILFQSAGTGYTLAKEAGSTGNWLVQQKDAKPLRADMTRVDALLDFIENHTPVRRLEQGGSGDSEQLAPFGLDKPTTVLTLKADKSWTIALGAKNPSGDGIYALSSQEPGVVLLDAGYEEQFGRAADHFYDLRLLDMTADTIERIRAEGAVEWELERTDDDGWAFTWPQELEGLPVAVHEANMYAYDLASLQGVAYAPDWTSPAPEDTVEIEFSVWRTGAEDPETLRLITVVPVVDDATLEEGEERTATYMGLSSWQTAPVQLEATAWDTLHKTAFYLQERSVISVNQGELERMELVSADKDRYKPLQGRKGESLWEDEQGEPLTGMDVLLWRLNDLKYQGPEQDELPGSASLTLTWNLWNADDVQTASIRFYTDPELPAGQCWVGVGEPPRYYPADSELLEDLVSRLPAAPQQEPASEQQAGSNATSEE